MNKKQLYAAPATEVLELRLEGVIATSEPHTLGSSQLMDSGLDGADWE